MMDVVMRVWVIQLDEMIEASLIVDGALVYAEHFVWRGPWRLWPFVGGILGRRLPVGPFSLAGVLHGGILSFKSFT